MDKNETTTYARHVWLGGHIYTEDDQAPLATALAYAGQKLIYVGDDETAQKLIGPNTLVTDLKGHTVVPGFIEGHAHLQSYGESLLRLRIRDLSRQEILKAQSSDAAPHGRPHDLGQHPGFFRLRHHR